MSQKCFGGSLLGDDGFRETERSHSVPVARFGEKMVSGRRVRGGSHSVLVARFGEKVVLGSRV